MTGCSTLGVGLSSSCVGLRAGSHFDKFPVFPMDKQTSCPTGLPTHLCASFCTVEECQSPETQDSIVNKLFTYTWTLTLSAPSVSFTFHFCIFNENLCNCLVGVSVTIPSWKTYFRWLLVKMRFTSWDTQHQSSDVRAASNTWTHWSTSRTATRLIVTKYLTDCWPIELHVAFREIDPVDDQNCKSSFPN